MQLNDITGEIVDAAFKIHKDLGPGLLESAYAVFLFHELTKRGLSVEKEVCVPVTYEGITLDDSFRADLIVEDTVIIELKSVEAVSPLHRKQLLTYLRLAGKPVGLLINFGAEVIKAGIHRIANGVPE